MFDVRNSWSGHTCRTVSDNRLSTQAFLNQHDHLLHHLNPLPSPPRSTPRKDDLLRLQQIRGVTNTVLEKALRVLDEAQQVSAEGASRRTLSREAANFMDELTPHGPVLQVMQVPGVDGDMINLPFVHPLACLFFMLHIFLSFVMLYMQGIRQSLPPESNPGKSLCILTMLLLVISYGWTTSGSV